MSNEKHIPCDFCKRGPLQSCEEILHCPATWDDDPDGCEDCKIDTDILYTDGEPSISFDLGNDTLPYDPRFDDCQILYEKRIISIEDFPPED